MQVLIAPDSMGGLLAAREVAVALAEGWASVRPGDHLDVAPLSDGGEGLLDVLHGPRDTAVGVEVAGPDGRPVDAWVSLRPDGTAIVESAMACGLHLLAAGRRDPWRATTWGVGQLLDAARKAGASRVLVGLGGSATVDGGAGALSGLGFRLRVADGSGLKAGAADLHRVATVETGWRHPAWADLEVELLADVRTVLADAPRRFGPQKGATPQMVADLEVALAAWSEVAERDLGAGGLSLQQGTGAAGGLGFGLAAGLGATIREGAAVVADLVGLEAQVAVADVVITGEGRVDATSFDGKVVGCVLERATAAGRPVAVVAGDVRHDTADGRFAAVERVPAATAEEARQALREAGARLARRLGTP